MEHLLTTTEVVNLGRPIGKVDEARLLAYITEAEQMNVKPMLGEKLFRRLLDEGDTDETLIMLLGGGTYTDADGEPHTFMGLKTAIAYFVYAQNVMSGDFQSTRFGMVVKNGDYSSTLSSKERSDTYNNAIEVATFYLNECVSYCKAMGLFANVRRKAVATNGCTIRKIG